MDYFQSLLSGVSMETESDQIIARLLKEDQGRSLDDMPFPFMELDEPFELLSEHSENGNLWLWSNEDDLILMLMVNVNMIVLFKWLITFNHDSSNGWCLFVWQQWA